MNIKLPFGIILSLFLFCNSAFAEQFLIGSVYADQSDGISVAVNLPPVLEDPPKASDFKLLNGDKLIKSADEIEPFAGSDKQLVLLFVVDISRSINKSLLKETQDALINIFSETLPNVRYHFGLASFADEVFIPPDFTDNPDVLIQSIRALKIAPKKPGGHKTLLYQALIDSLNQLNEVKPAEYRRLVIISDGKDEGSIETHDSVINLSKTFGIPIDAIGRGIIPKQYTDQLSGLAKATGGRFIYPRGESLSLKEAVIRLHKSAIENTWIVHFNYVQDRKKPMLANAVIQFQQNNAPGLSASVLKAIPDVGASTLPVSAVAPPEETLFDKVVRHLTQLKKQFPINFSIVGLGLLTFVTLIYIAWVFRDHIASWIKGKNEKEEILSTSFVMANPHPKKPDPRRQTEVISDREFHDMSMALPGIMLEVTSGPRQGQKIPVDKQRFRIGANKDNDLVLSDDYVSGDHALLSYENGVLLISDLHSRNGTRLNGELIKDKTSPVVPGNIIQIGISSIKIIAN